jgi:hypothetical protein
VLAVEDDPLRTGLRPRYTRNRLGRALSLWFSAAGGVATGVTTYFFTMYRRATGTTETRE